MGSTEPPSEAFDRREVVIITGEAIGQQKQKLFATEMNTEMNLSEVEAAHTSCV
jgi:hypothetical protein